LHLIEEMPSTLERLSKSEEKEKTDPAIRLQPWRVAKNVAQQKLHGHQRVISAHRAIGFLDRECKGSTTAICGICSKDRRTRWTSFWASDRSMLFSLISVTSRHAAGVLIDKNRKIIEFIDSCGWKLKEQAERRRLQRWFKEKLPGFSCVAVFHKRIQGHLDKYCMFWPIYYAYKRIAKEMTRAQFQREFNARPRKYRLQIIEEFWQTSVVSPSGPAVSSSSEGLVSDKSP
jgi:hypothetical protein